MPTTTKIQINDDGAGERLDKYLINFIKDQTRTQIQKLIESGQIKVNDKKPSKHKFLKKGDIIEVLAYKPITKEATGNIHEIELIDVQSDFIIVNKPSGMVVHADAAHNLEDSLSGQILIKYPEIKNIGEDPSRPGLVHRLDKGVSGLMIIARTQKSYDKLKQQFLQRKVDKTYLALTHGIIEKNKTSLDFPIIRKKDGFMAALPKGASGRESLTKINVLQRFKKYTYINVNIITGRTHQIRTHLNAYQHPIVGENYYINKKFKKDALQKSIKRIFLHSAGLKFNDTLGNDIEYKCPLPAYLQNLLNGLI